MLIPRAIGTDDDGTEHYETVPIAQVHNRVNDDITRVNPQRPFKLYESAVMERTRHRCCGTEVCIMCV